MNSSYNKGFHNETLGGNNHEWHQGRQDRAGWESGNTLGGGAVLFVIISAIFILPYAIISILVSLLMYPYGFRASGNPFWRFYSTILLTILAVTLGFGVSGLLVMDGIMKLVPPDYEFVILPLIVVACTLSILLGALAFYLRMKRSMRISYFKSLLITSFVILPLCLLLLAIGLFLTNEFYFKHNGMDFLNPARA